MNHRFLKKVLEQGYYKAKEFQYRVIEFPDVIKIVQAPLATEDWKVIKIIRKSRSH